MNIIKKVILAIKNIFIKRDVVKKLTESKSIIEQDKKKYFIESLKITTMERKSKKIEILTCEGDGLGIQKKITY